MPNYSHTISASWNRTGLGPTPGTNTLLYRVVTVVGVTLVDWTNAGLTEPVNYQYLVTGVVWDGSKAVVVYWQDELNRTAQEQFGAGVGTPVAVVQRPALLDRPMRGVGKLLIGLFGGEATLIRTVQNLDVENDTTTDETSQWSVKITPFESMTKEDYDTFRAAGSMVLAEDFKTTIAAKYLDDNSIPTPVVGWDLLKDGIQYRVKGVTKEYSGALPVLITLAVGR